MKRGNAIVLALGISMAVVLRPTPSSALLNGDQWGNWSIIGKVKAQGTFRTIDTPESNPIPIEAGDLTSQRNLIFLELKHNLPDLIPSVQLGYYVQGRAYYDGVWDYGPKEFSDDDFRREYLYDNRDQINDLKWDVELFMGYLDVKTGPFSARVGKQILSWGEMSTLRVLDDINPLDSSSLAVDLLERLVPLDMVRANLSFDYVGPFSSLSMQAYYVPGAIDNTNGEDIIDGSAVYPPIGRYTLEETKNPFSIASLMQIADQVPDDIHDDRYGVKLGALFGGLSLSLAYIRAYSDVPVPVLDVNAFNPVHLTWKDIFSIDINDPLNTLLGGQDLTVVLDYQPVNVFGGSFNWHWSLIDTVVRGEAAYYMDMPKMTPGSILDVILGLGGKIYLPGDRITIADLLKNISPGDLGKLVLPFSTGAPETFNIWKYGLGLDKFMKVPYLNDEDFIFILEYVGSATLGYKDKTILLPWEGPHGETLYESQFSNTFVFICNTNYFNGNFTPQLVTMLEVESLALALIPSASYQWRNFIFEASFFQTLSSNYDGQIGMLASKNEMSFSVTYNF